VRREGRPRSFLSSITSSSLFNQTTDVEPRFKYDFANSVSEPSRSFSPLTVRRRQLRGERTRRRA